jgi:small subunit ribosomal protein S16
MVRIRLRRVGAKRQPSFRVIVADRESPRDGRFLETIGHYNPRTVPATVVIDEAKLYQWLQKGAQPSESVVKILRTSGAWARWERVKGGEAVDGVLADVPVTGSKGDARTRRDDLQAAKPSRRAQAKAEKAAEAEAKEPGAA